MDLRKNKPYSVAYWDFKGPIAVVDDSAEYRQYKTKGKRNQNKDSIKEDPKKVKVYILSVTDALTRHVTFELVPNRTYESTKMALQRVFYERGACEVMISDQEPSFKAVAKDYSNTEAKETIK